MENLFPDNFDSYMSTIKEKIHLDGQQMVVSISGYPSLERQVACWCCLSVSDMDIDPKSLCLSNFSVSDQYQYRLNLPDILSSL